MGLTNPFTDALPTLGRDIQFSKFSFRNLCARRSNAHFSSLAFAESIRLDLLTRQLLHR